MDFSIEQQARKLVSSLASQCLESNGFGSFSPSVYDTAWISMVAKELVSGTRTFLFPEAFSYLLETQLPDGSWPAYSAAIDGILNTLAALLALKVRSRQEESLLSELEDRCQRAETALQSMLGEWDIKSTDRVGFEVLVPGLLRLLDREGIHFRFKGSRELMKLAEDKTAKLQHMIEGKQVTTLLHSLEAFIGILEFDKIQHHQMPNGSMLNSPSSTAAYLLNASEWDPEAEGYIRMVLDQYSLKGHKGGVPSAYPTPVFELSWTIVTLIKSGYTTQELGAAETSVIANYLADLVAAEGGKVGFAPSCLADADDTANALSALSILDRAVNIEPMLTEFEKHEHFITYRGERNASFSANCNVLLCLLQMPDKRKYTSQIVKCATFLDNIWNQGQIQDKWNTTSHYSTMLLAQAFVGLMSEFPNSDIDCTIDLKNLVSKRLPATLLDVLIHLIESQNPDGSWESKHEVSAYAVMALSALLAMPWPASVRATGQLSLENGKTYVLRELPRWEQGDHLWIEKVAYSLSTLSQAYCLAAAKISVPQSEILELSSIEPDKRLVKFFSRIVPFSKSPSWKLEACVAQSLYSLYALRKLKLEVFPEMEKTSNHEYLQFIPFTWIGCNHFYNCNATPKVLWEMMLVSMLNFQVDAYMETVIGVDLIDKLAEVRCVIDRLCGTSRQGHQKRSRDGDEDHAGQRPEKRRGPSVPADASAPDSREHPNRYDSYATTGDAEFTPPSSEPSTTSVREVEIVLRGFTTHMLKHPFVLQSPLHLQSWLRRSLHQFLNAHVTHIEDCILLSRDDFPQTTYHSWVHTTSADHTSCPFSFVFYLCLMHGRRAVKGEECESLFAGAQVRYLLEDACRHLATMCRQHNDFGSVARDRKEKNLNSINFPEFQGQSNQNQDAVADGLGQDDECKAKECLIEIAEYEQRCLELALEGVGQKVGESVMSELKLFFEVTNLYGRIYLARDIGIRRKA